MNRKLTKWCLALTALCVLSACSSKQGSGVIKTETRSVRDFIGVEVGGSAKLVVQQGETESLTVTADDNLLEYLVSEVKDSRLRLGTDANLSLSPTAPIVYNLTVKKLNSIGTSGAVTVEARDIRTDSLTAALAGSTEFSISGESAEQKIAIAGSADYKAENFKTKDTSIGINGSGKAVIAVSDRLDVQIVGSGDVTYVGDPEVTQNITGSGSVKPWMP